MGLSKSTYYYEIGKTDKVQERNSGISSEINAIFHEHKGRYGVRRVYQGCILSPCLFNFYAEYITRNAGLEEAQAGIKIAGRNINNLIYAENTPL